ncbi:MAG TPA: VWA domain-containing protein [Vicinamibacterales bacterium]|nr:VWA domain-containing protein [Vicinamibacterales bacterium]
MSAFPVLIGGALLVLAQQAPQQPTFRAATELVEVDVRVFDADGRFVTTLTADDFELREDGVERPVDVLYLVAGGDARIVHPTSSITESSTAAAARPTWIFVFDVTHLSPAGLQRTREAVRTFIASRFRDGDIGAVVGDKGMVNNRLTSDRQELERAAGSITLPGRRRSLTLAMREWPRLRDDLEALQVARDDREALRTAVMRACSEEPDLCRRGGDVEVLLREKARRLATEMQSSSLLTAKTLHALTRGLARVPGPKTVVLLSEGFISQHLESEVQSIVAQAGVAGARIYSIDARGLARGGIAEIMDARHADSPVGALGAGQDLLVDGVNALAVDTGGFAIRNENNFSRALDLIERDSSTYYVIGYRPANPAEDGKFRRIDVRVTQPALKVRARKGYLALPRARLLTATPIEKKHEEGAKEELPHDAGTAHDPALAAAGEIPRVPRTLKVSDETVRKVVELARGGTTARAEGSATAGWQAYQRGDVVTAAAELQAAVSSGDTRPWVRYALGFAHAARGEWRDALRAWEQVRSAVPEYQETYFDLADGYLQSGDAAAAVAVLRDAEQRWPSDAEVYNALGVVQVSRGALDDAVATFEKAVKTAPNDSIGYFNLGRAYSMRYFKSQRLSGNTGAWVANPRDRELAVAQFQKYLTLGGPYMQQAQEALAALAWK